MAKTSNHFILILCGGSGPRLWPLSRASRPKQFLELFDNQTLLQQTYSRYQKTVPLSNIFVISNAKYKSEINQQLKTLPQTNLILEPEKKNTAMAIIYGCSIIKKINSQAIITTAPADHFISGNFSKDIVSAVKIASSTNTIVTIGIKPTYPNPGFGYILSNLKFVEKPSIVDAQIYIKKGAYWNSGIYTFSLETFLNELKKHQLNYYSSYQQLLDHPKSINKIYKQSENLSFDVAISEKTSNLSTLNANFNWSDVGEWKAVYEKLTQKNTFAIINPNTKFIQTNSQKCLVSGSAKKLIGLVGVNNLAIIDTPDSLLVCNLNDSFSVRDLVSQIVNNPKLKNYFLKTND